MLDDFYALQGWDLERGWPTRQRLRQLGLEDLYEPMVTGAEEATVTGHHLEPSATDGRALIQDFWAIDRHA